MRDLLGNKPAPRPIKHDEPSPLMNGSDVVNRPGVSVIQPDLEVDIGIASFGVRVFVFAFGAGVCLSPPFARPWTLCIYRAGCLCIGFGARRAPRLCLRDPSPSSFPRLL
jgi:hypothetical protein